MQSILKKTTMMKQNKGLIVKLVCAMSLLLVLCIGCGNREAEVTLTPEQLRLQKIANIDSTSLKTILPLDSMEGYDRLAEISAEAWMLIDDSTGLVISQKNATRQLCMASITKMMTCLLALEKGNLADTLDITEDVYVARDSRVRVGDSFRLDDLINEMMLISDNDAAYAIAKHIGNGDTLTFCDMMNQKAMYLGMDSTHFANPNGVPNIHNYSCASDLVRLSRYAMCDSVFAQIVGTVEKDIPLTDGRHMPCRNTNALLSTYEGCIGIKTGFTRQAGNCLASAATRDGVTLYLVLLNSRSMSSRFKESALLLDYGFHVMNAYKNK